MGGSRRVSERYREIGKNIQSASDDGSALSNDVTLLVSNETGARVEVGAIVVILIESEHRDETDGRSRNKKCVIKSEDPGGGGKDNGPNTRRKDREIAKPTDQMGFNGVKIFKVQQNGGDVTGGPSVENKRHIVGVGSSDQGSRREGGGQSGGRVGAGNVCVILIDRRRVRGRGRGDWCYGKMGLMLLVISGVSGSKGR